MLCYSHAPLKKVKANGPVMKIFGSLYLLTIGAVLIDVRSSRDNIKNYYGMFSWNFSCVLIPTYVISNSIRIALVSSVIWFSKKYRGLRRLSDLTSKKHCTCNSLYSSGEMKSTNIILLEFQLLYSAREEKVSHQNVCLLMFCRLCRYPLLNQDESLDKITLFH